LTVLVSYQITRKVVCDQYRCCFSLAFIWFGAVAWGAIYWVI
jgi:hypothetical protein